MMTCNWFVQAFLSSDNTKTCFSIIGKKVKDKKIEKIRFDRSGYKYHGTIKALADAIRKEGIIF